MICFIPTKGRYNTVTYKMFESVGIEIKHFIEPAELDNYAVPNKVSILEDNRGIAYVRNFMLNYAKESGYEWVIVCDDDIEDFGIYENGKTNKKEASIWIDILEKAKTLPFELVGINYKQYAWTSKTIYSINRTFVECCILMNVSKITWKYREAFNLKEDRDFVLQTIKKGNGVLRFNYFWLGCPNVGSNTGGLQQEYKKKSDEVSARAMQKEWYPFVKLAKKGSRVDIKANIKAMAEYYRRIVK